MIHVSRSTHYKSITTHAPNHCLRSWRILETRTTKTHVRRRIQCRRHHVRWTERQPNHNHVAEAFGGKTDYNRKTNHQHRSTP
jgi:hypothetical protein